MICCKDGDPASAHLDKMPSRYSFCVIPFASACALSRVETSSGIPLIVSPGISGLLSDIAILVFPQHMLNVSDRHFQFATCATLHMLSTARFLLRLVLRQLFFLLVCDFFNLFRVIQRGF